MSYTAVDVPTKVYDGQKPGTSGLRKKVKVFQQEHYTENFIQATLSSMPAGNSGVPGPVGKTLVIGGDGRYWSPETVQAILRISAGNGVKKLIIGEKTILSTPAASALIRQRKTDGGILLTASHNPGGPDNDFGIKFNCDNGGPAPEDVTEKIYQETKVIKSYKFMDLPELDLTKVGTFQHGPLEVEIVDSVENYVRYMKTIFDFDMIKAYLHSPPAGVKPPTVLFDAMSGVTGPYGKAIFLDTLGLPADSVQNCDPLPDFGGHHPDPNLTYAHELVEQVEKRKITFGAASDGDGDRNMIYGCGAFVTPSDSVAIIADWAEKAIPYFSKANGGVVGLARSMPTSGALDRVAESMGVPIYETPTGWKFFGNLFEVGKLSICGEESFGTGSSHVTEKDGVWSIIAWLSILAAANKEKPGADINSVMMEHWQKYGRNFFARYDYEEVDSEHANAMMEHLTKTFAESSFAGKVCKAKTSDATFTVKVADNFAYTDPVDGSVSKNQGLRIVFEDGSRIVFRLSGTGSSGATIRGYFEKYSNDPSEYGRDTQEGLKPLIEVALELSQLTKFTGREKPTVIT